MAQGIRNGLWSTAKEQVRFRRLVSAGLARSIVTSGIQIVLFGGLVAFASRSVPQTIAWQILGLSIVVLGSIGMLVGKFAAIQTPTLEQMPDATSQRRRVIQRRMSGALFIIGSFVWTTNGATSLGW